VLAEDAIKAAIADYKKKQSSAKIAHDEEHPEHGLSVRPERT
jgi:hypothetical protein